MKLWEIKHPYHISEGNYFDRSYHTHFKSLTEFLDEFDDADKNYNWVVRWDWREGSDWDLGEYNGDNYYRHARFLIQMIGQRKALLQSYEVEVCRADEPTIVRYLQNQWNYMREMWSPFSDMGDQP